MMNDIEIIEINNPIVVSPQSSDVWDDFCKDCKRNNLSETTLSTYKRAYDSFVRYLSDKQITNPTSDDFVEYRDHLKENHKPNTVQLYVVGIRQFFKWTERNRLYPNITDGIKGARVDRLPKKDYLTAEHCNEVLESILLSDDTKKEASARDYAILSLMMVCGLRDIEVSRANWEDIRTMGGSWILVIQGKGRADKTEFVVLPDKIREILFDYKSSLGNVAPSDPIFYSLSNQNSKGRLTTRSISRIVKSRLIDAGFDSNRLTAHSLRHSSITIALENGVSLEEVQQHARHKSMSTTLIYDHALKAEKNRSSTVASEAIFNGSSKKEK